MKTLRRPRRNQSNGRLWAALPSFVAIGLGVGAILVPHNAAQALMEPNTIWSVRTSNATNMAAVDPVESDGVLLTFNAVGLNARNLQTSEDLWEYVDSDILQTFISNDRHVLARGNSLKLLSPDGEKLWERANDEYPVAAEGDVVVLRDCDGDGCEFQGVDGQENVVFEYSTARDPLAKVPYSLGPVISTNVEEGWSDSVSPSGNLPVIAVIEADGKTATALDAHSGETFHIDSITAPAISGDIIMHRISQDADGQRCDMAGTRAGGEEVWREEMPCASWGIVIEDRYYGSIPNGENLSNDAEDLQDTLTVDLRTGTWRQHKPAMNWNPGHDSQTSVLGSDMIIERNGQELTAVDPDTGDEMWQTTIPGKSIPGVDIAHGGVATLSRPAPTFNPFVAQDSGASIRVLDGQAGETASHYVRESVPWSVIPVGTDRALVNEVSEVILLGR